MPFASGFVLVFQRAALRLQGYKPDFESGLFDASRGFEDYSRKDGSAAKIMSGMMGNGYSTVHYSMANDKV